LKVKSLAFYREENLAQTAIGRIPRDWTVVTIGEIAETMSGGTPSRIKKEYYGGNIPWVKSGELKDNNIYNTSETITEEGLRNSSAKLLRKGTLLVALYGATVGKTGILGIDATTNQAICAITPKENKLEPYYLKYQIIARRNELVSASSGGAQPNISQGIIRAVRIPLPALEEQHEIAEVLSNVDQTTRTTDQIIAKTELLKKTLMQQLLTRGIGHKEFRDSEIGRIPKSWNVSRLGDVAKVERGKFSHRPRNAPEFYGGKIPFIQTGDIAKTKGIIRNYSQTLNEKGLKISRLFKKGTIVVSIAGNIGDIGMLGFDACFPDSVVGISAHDEMHSMFLMYLLQIYQQELSGRAPRSTQKNINLQILKSIRIPVPSADEQRQIASVLSSIDGKLEVERNEGASLEKAKQGLMNLLLTGKIRIKVD